MRFAIVMLVLAMAVYVSACNGKCGGSNNKGLLGNGVLNGGVANGGVLNSNGGGKGSGSKGSCPTCGGNVDNVSTSAIGDGINVSPAIKVL